MVATVNSWVCSRYMLPYSDNGKLSVRTRSMLSYSDNGKLLGLLKVNVVLE